MVAAGSITQHLNELKGSDDRFHHHAAQRLWEVYFKQMVELARQRLQGAPRRIADEEDVALSAFHSFYEGIRAGRFPQLSDRNTLWPLLVAITAHKSVDLIRRENRLKRGGTGGVDLSDEIGAGRAPLTNLDQIIAEQPSPDFALQVAEQLDQLFRNLDATGDSDLRKIAQWKMEGIDKDEIAARLRCVRRTVDRKLQLITQMLTKEDRS